MESPYEEYKYKTNEVVADGLWKNGGEFTVFWKFEDPLEKETNFDGVPKQKQKHFMTDVLNQKGHELLRNKTDETILGRSPDNLFVITNDVYETAKQKKLALIKATDEHNERSGMTILNKQVEELRVNNLIAVGGESYFQYMNELWNEKDPYGDTKLKGKNEELVYHFTKVLKALTKRLDAIQNSPIREGGFQYNCVNKRKILGNGFQSCSPANFAFPKEEWEAILENMEVYDSDNCHPSSPYRNSRCILVLYKGIIKAVNKEFGCLSPFGILKSKAANVLNINQASNLSKGGKTRCKTKGKGSKRRRGANKKTKNKK